MDFEALQATQESCRVYSDRPVPRETLAHLVDVARLAPSGCNAQPWRFIIIDEPEARAKLIEALDDDGLTGCPWGDRVPNFILICEDEAHVKPGVAEQAAERLAAQYPGLKIAGTHDGYFKDDAPVAEAIWQSGADCVFVCLGAPKQELWMAQWGPETGAHLLCGLGGSLDVFAGVVERAPKFWSDHGLEWFYRLCKEPKRIGRMMKLPLFLVHVRKEKRKK